MALTADIDTLKQSELSFLNSKSKHLGENWKCKSEDMWKKLLPPSPPLLLQGCPVSKWQTEAHTTCVSITSIRPSIPWLIFKESRGTANSTSNDILSLNKSNCEQERNNPLQFTNAHVFLMNDDKSYEQEIGPEMVKNIIFHRPSAITWEFFPFV